MNFLSKNICFSTPLCHIVKIIFLISSFISISCTKEETSLKVAVAANAQFALREIVKDFENITDIDIDLIIGSSGNLTSQIKNGAPFHVFLSADMKYPNELYKSELTYNKPEIYAFGKLVLWSLNENELISMDLLEVNKIQKIALGNPKTAPYGVAAFESLKFFGMDEQIKNKLVYGESISQVNHFIISKSVDVGFTSLSSVLANRTKTKGNYQIIDSTTYNPIEQGIVVLKNDPEFLTAALKFYNYVYSERGKVILGKYGYGVNHE